MTSSHKELTFDVRARRSLERSRERRKAAWRARRRKFRLRGGALSLASTALAVAAIGAGAAVGQQQAATSTGLLAEGAQGSEVTAVQKALGLSASGAFDAKTEAAVERFQRSKGLAVDGVVGPQTKAALGLAPAQPAEQTGDGAAANPVLEAIAQCESGGNPQAIGGGGLYRGKYQFTRETWAAVGGTGDPAAAPEAEQDRRAAMLYEQSGPSQWPACGG